MAVKARIAYVPDAVAFYPWMSVRETLDYVASFRPQWNDGAERALAGPVPSRLRQKASHLSDGQRTQLALSATLKYD